MLSPAEADALERGQELKRYVRSAAALRDIYDDTALAEAVGRTRMAVGKWWRGVRPEPDAIRALGTATGLSVDELTRYLYFDGPPPTPPNRRPRSNRGLTLDIGLVPSETELGVREGDERDRTRRGRAGPSRPVPLRPRRPPGSGEG